jgi:uncharacterized membrane protein YhaH (DUF805 family)
MQGSFFSFAGRISRRTYWMLSVLPGMISGIVISWPWKEEVQNFVSANITLVFFFFVLFSWVFHFVPSAKRLHDRNKSAWWLLLGFVPVIGYFLLLCELAFFKGTHGENNYGPDPLTEGQQQSSSWGKRRYVDYDAFKTVIVPLAAPLAEDELVIMDIIKGKNPDIERIFVSPRRNELRFVLSASSDKTKNSIIKILKNFGVV